jgi:hypothetical protein
MVRETWTPPKPEEDKVDYKSYGELYGIVEEVKAMKKRHEEKK